MMLDPAALARFWSKVDRSGGPDACWPWLGGKTKAGYGVFYLTRGRREYAHRVAYALVVGPIPEGREIDHVCRTPGCVNAAAGRETTGALHLEPVTHQENVARGEAPSAIVARTGVCSRGHSMNDAIVHADGRRECRACRNENKRANRAKRLADGSFTHGTIDGYYVGCRCELCVDAQSAYKRDWRSRRES